MNELARPLGVSVLLHLAIMAALSPVIIFKDKIATQLFEPVASELLMQIEEPVELPPLIVEDEFDEPDSEDLELVSDVSPEDIAINPSSSVDMSNLVDSSSGGGLNGASSLPGMEVITSRLGRPILPGHAAAALAAGDGDGLGVGDGSGNGTDGGSGDGTGNGLGTINSDGNLVLGGDVVVNPKTTVAFYNDPKWDPGYEKEINELLESVKGLEMINKCLGKNHDYWSAFPPMMKSTFDRFRSKVDRADTVIFVGPHDFGQIQWGTDAWVGNVYSEWTKDINYLKERYFAAGKRIIFISDDCVQPRYVDWANSTGGAVLLVQNLFTHPTLKKISDRNYSVGRGSEKESGN